MSHKKNTSSDLQGITSLITEATLGITDLVEAMHQRIVHPPFLPSTPIQHLITDIASITYKSIRWSTRLIGSGTNKALGQLSSVLGSTKVTEEREAMRSVLNGVIGDHLEKTENPLSIKMQFRQQGKAISLDPKQLAKAYPSSNGKILVMVHGSCMNDLQWSRKEHNHGTALAQAFGMTPLFLRYNSGRHISTNGQDFNALLETLTRHWPVPVENLVFLAHSMGGLVTRSAVHYGLEQKMSWPKQLKKIIFLGTPHHGAPLEKLGNYLDLVLESIPYSKPFARLGKIRSAGITDLRYGNLLDEDWQEVDRFELAGDHRQKVPLPAGIDCYAIAGIASEKAKNGKVALWRGDNLVSVQSALGQHKKPTKKLAFKKENTWIAYAHNHLDLLSHPETYLTIKDWI